MTILFADNAYTYLAAQVLNSATAPFTFTVSDGSSFPTPGANEYFVVTFEDASLNRENFKISARSGNTLTVAERTYGGGSARSWAATTTLVEVRLVSQALTDHMTEATDYADLKVAKSGDTMTGTLTMSGGSTHIILPNTPSIDNHAARKKYVDDMFANNLPAGMTTLVYSTLAPAGWSRVTNSDIHGAALRIHADGGVSITDAAAGTYGDDQYIRGGSGTNTFAAIFGTSKATESHTLTTAQMPAHTHTASSGTDSPDHTHAYTGTSMGLMTAGSTSVVGYQVGANTGGASARHTHAITVNSEGGGTGHTHNLNFNLKYANFMVVTKNAY